MIKLRLATEADSGHLKSLLRDNPMAGWVDITVEREPSYFKGVNIFSEDYPVIAKRNNEVVGMYCASLSKTYINGMAVSAGYLGGLRVALKFRNAIGILRRGFESIQYLVPDSERLGTWFTSIATDNHIARRLLEADIKGLPKYELIGQLITLAVPVTKGKNHHLWQPLDKRQQSEFLDFYHTEARKYHLTPVISAAQIEQSSMGQFFIFKDNEGIAATISLWDQSAYKQIMANRYKWPLSLFLPLYNLFASVTSRVSLPEQGKPLQQTWLAFFCVADRAEHQSIHLIENALFLCKTPVAAIGLHSSHQLIPQLARMKPMKLPLNLYRVAIGKNMALDNRPVQPEAALL